MGNPSKPSRSLGPEASQGPQTSWAWSGILKAKDFDGPHKEQGSVESLKIHEGVVDALCSRKCASDILCPICQKSPEHLLLLCDWSRSIWFGSPISFIMDPMDITSFKNWCRQFLIENTILSDYDKADIASLCWNIWKTRSASVFNAATLNPVHVLSLISSVVEEFWKINRSEKSNIPVHEACIAGWIPPDSGIIKITCDGTLSLSTGKAAIGVICRDNFDHFIKGWRELVTADSSFMSKLLACKKAIIITSDFSNSHALIETDCLELFKAFSCKGTPFFPWPLHGIVGDLFASPEFLPFISLSFSKHRKILLLIG
ncbi:uncharacterized protein LOC129302143 [Prosopis cineraria]|uniref:uncharacterized protein LOC129302143 n=1 Tax=Prosopis cineraria TaxID=364024 RepID=UPI00241012AC|nr:uncharacterized protein LOC129302143 [Prosopis cineraria]